MKVGYFLATEEFPPAQLLAQATMAERAGFDALWVSDHFHPWNDAQGHSPFVWSVVGALSQVTKLPVATAVTCPTVRLHPAIVAQAAATSSVMHEGRFTLGVGTGEALNEHVLGDRWPSAEERLDMLAEAVDVIRLLLRGGNHSHHGRHYRIVNARLYTLPEQPTPVYVSGFGPKAIRLAARIGDGFVAMTPDPDVVRAFREQGGGSKPVQGGFKVCHAPSEDAGAKTAHRLWASEQLPGELGQVLPTPRHIEQASQLVTVDMVRDAVPCGPDPERYVDQFHRFAAAGYDEVYVQQIGPDQEAFFRFFASEIRPRLQDVSDRN